MVTVHVRKRCEGMGMMELSTKELELMNEWVIGQESARVGKTTVVCLKMECGNEFIGLHTTFKDENQDVCNMKATKKALDQLDDHVYNRLSKHNAWF